MPVSGIAVRGISKILKKTVPKKSKKFPGEKTLEIMGERAKKRPTYRGGPSGKGFDVYERVGRDQSRRDRTADVIKDFRKGKFVGKAGSKDPKTQRSQTRVFPQNKKQLVDRIREINKDLIKQRKENYKSPPSPKKRKTLKLKDKK